MAASRFGARTRLSVVIPTRNRREELARSLPAVLRELREGDEAIVVDNGSSDGTLAALRPRFGDVRWIELGKNLSCASRNVGAGAARGDVLVMMDDDSVPEPGAFDAIRSVFEEDDGVGAVACRIRLMNSPGRHDAGGLAGVVVNCGAAIRCEAFVSVGGYPIGFDYYAEEYDLCCKLWLAGWRIVPRGEISFLHARSLVNRDANRMVARLVRNNLEVWGRYAPTAQRERLMLETIDRYSGVARKEDALAGFGRGLAEWRAEAAVLTRRARPLANGQMDELFGISVARARLRRQRDRLALRRVGVWGRGKGCPQLIDLLREVHLDVVAIYEDVRVEERWQGCSVRPREAVRDDRLDGLVPGTLSLGAAEDLSAELRGAYPDVATVTAIDWSAVTHGSVRTY